MKPGDLLEFKSGLFGLAPPKNLGIYLDRVKKAGNFHIVIFTLRGKQEIRPDNVTSRKLTARVDTLDPKDLEARLKALIQQFSTGALDEKPKLAPGEMNDRVLWNKVWDAGVQSPEEMAARYHGEKPPKRGQVEGVRNVLADCARPGVGYFERLPGREERWRPLTLDEYKRAKQELEGLNKLRKKLVTVEEIEPEDDWEKPRTVFHAVPIAEAGLDEEDRERLALACEVMRSFVLHDRDTGEITLPGTPVHTIDGAALFTFVRWLALDWVGEERASLSSNMVEFLIDSGAITTHEAMVLIAKRKVLANGSFEWETRPDVERAAERFSREFPLEGRADLRALPNWTIDPPDAKDHDDSVGVEFHADGRTTLWVHIADVSHYVEKDGALDRHGRKRATSVYLPTGVLPMLPTRLSNDLCSLNEGEDRFAMTVAITYDAAGAIVEERFLESVIRVTGNVTYDEVLAQIAHGDPGNVFVRMEAFARSLDAKRRGLPIETGERRITISEREVTHTIKTGNAATKMIEVFMVAANEAVARHLTREGVPVPYRCHPLPDRVSVARFNAQMKTMELPVEITLPPPEAQPDADAPAAAKGPVADSFLEALKTGGKVQLFGGGFSFGAAEDAEPEPEEATSSPEAPKPLTKGLAQLTPEEQEAWLAPFREALAKVQALPDDRLRAVVYVKSLACMGRAIYTPANLGHFGLGSTCYAHFTSPIRRYADLVTHRQLRWLLRGRDGDAPHDAQELDDICVHLSEQSSAAESLERGTVDAGMVFASRDGGWDGTQPGLVNGITRGGVFLSLPRGLEARLATADVPGGPWSVDDSDSMLFAGSADRPELEREVTGANWRDLYNPDLEEVVRVRFRLGDTPSIVISGRDYVDGRVSAKLAGADDGGDAPAG